MLSSNFQIDLTTEMDVTDFAMFEIKHNLTAIDNIEEEIRPISVHEWNKKKET